MTNNIENPAIDYWGWHIRGPEVESFRLMFNGTVSGVGAAEM